MDVDLSNFKRLCKRFNKAKSLSWGWPDDCLTKDYKVFAANVEIPLDGEYRRLINRGVEMESLDQILNGDGR